MSILPDDVYSRRGAGGARGTILGLPLFLLVLLSIGLLALSRLQHGLVIELQSRVESAMAPLLAATLEPLEPLRRLGRDLQSHVALTAELDRLRAENQRLRGWEARAQELERRLARLEQLAKTVQNGGVEQLSARVISHGSGPFVRIALVNAGVPQGVRPGFPVVDADGLVGRVVGAGERASRVLLLTDINSRIPVVVGDGEARAILVGDNGPQPRLSYVASYARIENGDVVSTSGVGGVFPRGLRIGTAIVTGDVVRVKPYAAFGSLEYVSILFHDDPAGDLAEEDKRGQPAGRAGRRGAPPQPADAAVGVR